MNRFTLIRGARQLLTLQGSSAPRRGADLRNLGMIQDGSVLIADGLIREVGPTRRIENLAEARKAEEINAHGKVVLPGFIDSHTHLVSGPARLADYEMRLAGASTDQITQAGGGWTAIYRSMQELPLRTLEAQAWRIVRDTIRQGTTTLEARSGFGVTEAAETKILRTHAAVNHRLGNMVSTFMAAQSLPSELFVSNREYIDWVSTQLLPMVRRRRLAEFFDVSCEENGLTLLEARRLLVAAREQGFKLKLHAGQYWNTGGAQLAVELGAVSLDHAIYLDQDDINALAQSRTVVNLLPGPIFYLGTQRYAPARKLIDRGAIVALATNYNPVTCPTHNMQMILALACTKMNMTPAEAIAACTINGAHAVGRADSIGSIEFGKHADLVMLNVPDYREIPYHFGVNLVDMTMKTGRVIYRASEVLCFE